jgi:hypothetical protein
MKEKCLDIFETFIWTTHNIFDNARLQFDNAQQTEQKAYKSKQNEFILLSLLL